MRRGAGLSPVAWKKAPANHEGLFAYFFLAWNSSIWIFSDEDLICSSNRRNSAVSSAIDFGGGLGGNGITSDIGKTSLGAIPCEAPSRAQMLRFCGADFRLRRECALNNSNSVGADQTGIVRA